MPSGTRALGFRAGMTPPSKTLVFGKFAALDFCLFWWMCLGSYEEREGRLLDQNFATFLPTFATMVLAIEFPKIMAT